MIKLYKVFGKGACKVFAHSPLGPVLGTTLGSTFGLPSPSWWHQLTLLRFKRTKIKSNGLYIKLFYLNRFFDEVYDTLNLSFEFNSIIINHLKIKIVPKDLQKWSKLETTLWMCSITSCFSTVLRNLLHQYHKTDQVHSLRPRPQSPGRLNMYILAKESSIWSILIQCNRFFRWRSS